MSKLKHTTTSGDGAIVPESKTTFFTQHYPTLEAAQASVTPSFFEVYGVFVSPDGRYAATQLRCKEYSDVERDIIARNVERICGYQLVAYSSPIVCVWHAVERLDAQRGEPTEPTPRTLKLSDGEKIALRNALRFGFVMPTSINRLGQAYAHSSTCDSLVRKELLRKVDHGFRAYTFYLTKTGKNVAQHVEDDAQRGESEAAR